MSDSHARQDWTTNELAEAAGVDTSYLRHMLLDGRLMGRKRGRDWLIPYEEGQRWLERRRNKKKKATESND